MKFRRKGTSDEISGFLDQGTSVTGELQFSGTLRIDGNFHGSISTADVLVVGEHAFIHADISVGDIEIHGKVCGRIESKRRVDIFPTGRVQGDVHCPVIAMQPGGVLDGRSFMSADAESAAPTQETTKADKRDGESIHNESIDSESIHSEEI
jgi:cytoskeletal protein CcmA (bactofilin family)